MHALKETKGQDLDAEQESSSNRTRTSILVAANTRAGGVASMGVRAG
eukprot:COSAG05_NODE_26389_length_188_cov_122.752809_1_plen_46_part_01